MTIPHPTLSTTYTKLEIEDNFNWETARINGVGEPISDYGVLPDGTDITPAMSSLPSGKTYLVGPGDYLIAAAGSTGVKITLTGDIAFICHPQARFYTDGVDSDLIRITTGTTDVTSRCRVYWSGGCLDQRNQKVSTVVPYNGTSPFLYPPLASRQGTSARTNALAIGPGNEDSPTNTGQTIDSIIIKDLYVKSTDTDWTEAGGDSGLALSAHYVSVTSSVFEGCRDLGIYLSGTSKNTPTSNLNFSGDFHVSGCRFVNGMFGVASKRGANRISVSNNTFYNMIGGAFVSATIQGVRTRSVSFVGNVFEQTTYPVGLENVDGGVVTGNSIVNMGTLAMGTTVAASGGGTEVATSGTRFKQTGNPIGVKLEGCTYCIVSSNVFQGEASVTSGSSFDSSAVYYGPALSPTGTAFYSDCCLVTDNLAGGLNRFLLAGTLTISGTPYTQTLLNNVVTGSHITSGSDDNLYDVKLSKISTNPPSTLIINSSDAITVSQSYHYIDTSSSSVLTDNLKTIYGGGAAGQLLVLKTSDSTKTITVKDSTGNISLASDFAMNNINDVLTLMYDEILAKWVEISRSDNA